MAKQYETVIGLEVHVELPQRQKYSAAAPPLSGERPIPHTCPRVYRECRERFLF